MRVIVTRPEREAGRWARELRQHGFEVLALPLIAIAPAPDPQPLHDAWRRLGEFRALMFVSGSAVEHFFMKKEAVALTGWALPAIKTRAWAPGPGTREALARAGVDPSLIDAPASDATQFDSQALWRQVARQVAPGGRVLIVRGADGHGQGPGRDWLAARLAAAGVLVETVVAYVRRAPDLGAEGLAQAQLAAADGSAWLFSSSQAIANLTDMLPGQNWSQARAVATHPRIALAARSAGFGVVCESRPALEALIAAIESIR